MKITPTSGGVCAAKGFQAAGMHIGIRNNTSKKDLSLIYSEVPAHAAAVYTTNLVKGAPLVVTKRHLADGIAQAVLCNSGNANTCNADGIDIAEEMSCLAARELGLDPHDVVVASTGVIGQPLNMAPIRAHMGELAARLEHSEAASDAAAQGIMTTDTVKKEFAVRFELGGKVCTLGGIGKGSGMIHPNMATMLVFLTTDAAISADLLHRALSHDVRKTFNMLSVDGDTSTNDMVVLLANGLAGNDEVTDPRSPEFAVFMKALNTITVQLCRSIAGDGEGATKLLECRVSGANSPDVACVAAKSVITSSLVKAAMFGADANWGRVLCALGYCGADLDVDAIDVSFVSRAGRVEVCKDGAGIPFSEELAKQVLSETEIEIAVRLGDGDYGATAWGCDLTYDYVKINGDYRT